LNATNRRDAERASAPAVLTAAWEFARTPQFDELLKHRGPLSSADLNRAIGLAWKVYQTPAFFFVPTSAGARVEYNDSGIARVPSADGYLKLVGHQVKGGAASPASYLNVRDDLHEIVGVVKKRYRVLQNDEAPSFLDELVESGDGSWEVAGALHRGAQVFWLMKIGSAISVQSDRREILQMYLLLRNSHDGSTSMTVSALASRPRSRTTLAYDLPRARRLMKVRHTDSARNRAIEAHRALDLSRTYQREFVELAGRMIDVRIGDQEFYAFVGDVVPIPKPRRQGTRTVNQRGITVAENTRGLIASVYFNNETQDDIRGTLWGAVQACQFVADHLSTSRNTEASADENRFKRLTSESTLGSKAFLLARRGLPR
jgi:phage/plasmid-like protein (TIGR03299 family)